MKKHPIFKIFTSLWLTIALLICSLVIIFFGTMAQGPMGLKESMDRFFLSWTVDQVAMEAALSKTKQLLDPQAELVSQKRIVDETGFPMVFPGGLLVAVLLLINLLTAYYQRFEWSAKKAGIYMTHVGIITLLVGQIVIDKFKEESFVHMERGDRKDYSVSFDDNELVFMLPITKEVTRTNELGDKISESVVVSNRVVSIPEDLLKKVGTKLTHPQLEGLSFEVKRYWVNAKPHTAKQLVELDREGQANQRQTVVDQTHDVINARIIAMEEALKKQLSEAGSDQETVRDQRTRLTSVKGRFIELQAGEFNLNALADILALVGDMESRVFGWGKDNDQDKRLVYNNQSVRGLLLKIRAYEDQRTIGQLFNTANEGVLDGCSLEAFDSNATDFKQKIRDFPGEKSDKWITSSEKFVKRIRAEAKKYYSDTDTGDLGNHFRFIQNLDPVLSDNSRNLPAVTVEITHTNAKGKETRWGTYLFTCSSDFQQTVRKPENDDTSSTAETQPDAQLKPEDHKWKVIFRPKQHFLDFNLSLVDLDWDVYPGTVPEIPKNFSSKVVVEDESEPRTVVIWMNHPLRNKGRTFYQQSMTRDQITSKAEETVLQVVKNLDFSVGGLVVSSGSIPYIGCVIVSLGLIYQFMFHLMGFARKRVRETDSKNAPEKGSAVQQKNSAEENDSGDTAESTGDGAEQDAEPGDAPEPTGDAEKGSEEK